MFASLRGYRPEWLRGDLVAGLTVWAVLVPESLAYASIAGMSPVVGLYAAPPALVLNALLVARDIGQVRDILRDEDGDQRLFPSVEAAVTQAR
jgi:sulfate permease family protein